MAFVITAPVCTDFFFLFIHENSDAVNQCRVYCEKMETARGDWHAPEALIWKLPCGVGEKKKKESDLLRNSHGSAGGVDFYRNFLKMNWIMALDVFIARGETADFLLTPRQVFLFINKVRFIIARFYETVFLNSSQKQRNSCGCWIKFWVRQVSMKYFWKLSVHRVFNIDIPLDRLLIPEYNSLTNLIHRSHLVLGYDFFTRCSASASFSVEIISPRVANL